MQDQRHVAVLMGGWSAEREISIWCGTACADALERLGHRVTRVDVGRDIATVLTQLRPDVALNLLHGPPGGDGTVQALLELLGIPYSHSGVMAAAVATRKDVAKSIFRDHGIRVPEGRVLSRFEAGRAHALPPPYVVKPLAEGSSLGVLFVMDADEPPPAELLEEAWRFGDAVICETYIPGLELACAVVDDRALGVVETVMHRRFNDHAEKMDPVGSPTKLPAPLPPDVYAEVQRLSLAAHRALGCRGVTRTDLRYDPSKGVEGVFVLELNNQPGMMATSLVPEIAAHAGIGFDQLVEWMLQDASLSR